MANLYTGRVTLSSVPSTKRVNKVYTGRLRSEVQPFTLLYTILSEKVPVLYTFY